ncbi:MAG: 2-oxo acid dehydrogenase subunit E2 [Candidatus Limnocylindrales bacterium]
MRAAIARRMVQSKRDAPHFYVSAEIELDDVLADAAERNAGRGRDARLTLTAYLVRAVASALARHPTFNAVWGEAGLELVDSINIGVAIATNDGLIAPAVLDCGQLELQTIGVRLRDLIARTHGGKLRAAELTGPTFTLSNLGMYDVSAFTAIVVPPQVAILATAKSEPRPVVRHGQIVVRQIMTATLSSDHRAVDGAAAAQFLADVKLGLERNENSAHEVDSGLITP